MASLTPRSFACFVSRDKVRPVLAPEMGRDVVGGPGIYLLAFSLSTCSALAFFFLLHLKFVKSTYPRLISLVLTCK